MTTLHPSKGSIMKETFYHQIREFGILVDRNRTSETWMVRGCSITIYFKDAEHRIIDLITL